MDKEYAEVKVSFKVPQEDMDRFAVWLQGQMSSIVELVELLGNAEYLDIWIDEWLAD